MSFKKIPASIGGRLAFLQESVIKAQGSFDSDQSIKYFALTDEEHNLLCNLQHLGSDFIQDLIDLIDMLPPGVYASRSAGDFKHFLPVIASGYPRLPTGNRLPDARTTL